jgi:hypothetical protein
LGPKVVGLVITFAQHKGGAGAPLSATRIGNRVALARAMVSGLGVVEFARTTAAAGEINELAAELRCG